MDFIAQRDRRAAETNRGVLGDDLFYSLIEQLTSIPHVLLHGLERV